MILQNKSGSVDGRTQLIFDDGSCDIDAETRRHICGYVMQDDRILATETVEEALTFGACMALPNDVPQDSIPAAVDAVVQQLALQNVRTSRVGSSDVGGLSGGERRRLAVGLELITKPAVSKSDEVCVNDEGFSIQNDEFCRCCSRTSRHPVWTPTAVTL